MHQNSSKSDSLDSSDLQEEVYAQLRSLALSLMSKEQPGQTMQATALVHEAYVRLSQANPSRWKDRKHFYIVAAQAMRRILVDRARQRARRPKVWKGDMDSIAPAALFKEKDKEKVNIVDLDDALRRLSIEDPRAAQLVALRFFAGMTLEDAGETLGISRSTAKRDWSYAKAWLQVALYEGDTQSRDYET